MTKFLGALKYGAILNDIKLAGYFLNHSDDTNLGYSFVRVPVCPLHCPFLFTPRQPSPGHGMKGREVVLVRSLPRVYPFRITDSYRGSASTGPSFCFNKTSKCPQGKSGFLCSVPVSGFFDFGIIFPYMFLNDRSFFVFIFYSLFQFQ